MRPDGRVEVRVEDPRGALPVVYVLDPVRHPREVAFWTAVAEEQRAHRAALRGGSSQTPL
jgi:hypothetical protein